MAQNRLDSLLGAVLVQQPNVSWAQFVQTEVAQKPEGNFYRMFADTAWKPLLLQHPKLGLQLSEEKTQAWLQAWKQAHPRTAWQADHWPCFGYGLAAAHSITKLQKATQAGISLSTTSASLASAYIQHAWNILWPPADMPLGQLPLAQKQALSANIITQFLTVCDHGLGLWQSMSKADPVATYDGFTAREQLFLAQQRIYALLKIQGLERYGQRYMPDNALTPQHFNYARTLLLSCADSSFLLSTGFEAAMLQYLQYKEGLKPQVQVLWMEWLATEYYLSYLKQLGIPTLLRKEHFPRLVAPMAVATTAKGIDMVPWLTKQWDKTHTLHAPVMLWHFTLQQTLGQFPGFKELMSEPEGGLGIFMPLDQQGDSLFWLAPWRVGLYSLLAANAWKRPIYLSNYLSYVGLKEYWQFEGLAARLTPMGYDATIDNTLAWGRVDPSPAWEHWQLALALMQPLPNAMVLNYWSKQLISNAAETGHALNLASRPKQTLALQDSLISRLGLGTFKALPLEISSLQLLTNYVQAGQPARAWGLGHEFLDRLRLALNQNPSNLEKSHKNQALKLLNVWEKQAPGNTEQAKLLAQLKSLLRPE